MANDDIKLGGGKESIDDWDMGDDFLMEEDVPPPARAPAAAAISGIASAGKDLATDKGFIGDIIKSAMPSTISSLVDDISGVGDGIADELSEITKSASPMLKGMVDKGATFGKDSFIGGLANKVSNALDLEDRAQTAAAPTKKQMQDATIEDALGSIFKQQAQGNAKQFRASAELDAVKLQIDNDQRNVDRTISLSTAQSRDKYLDNINRSVGTLASYQTSVTMGYQRKNLDIGLRTMFLLKDIRGLTRSTADAQVAQLNDIILNTSLPDIIKSRKAERAGVMLEQRLGQMKFDVLYGGAASRITAAGKKLIGRAGGAVKNALAMASSASSEASGQVGELGEMLSERIADNPDIDPNQIRGEEGLRFIATLVAPTLGSFLGNKLDRSGKLSGIDARAGNAINEGPDMLINRLNKLSDDTGGVASFAAASGAGFLSDIFNTTGGNTGTLTDVTVAQFDNKVYNSITVGLPGYLSRILSALTGEERLDFNPKFSEFEKSKDVINRARSMIVNGDITARVNSAVEGGIAGVKGAVKLDTATEMALGKVLYSAASTKAAGGEDATTNMSTFLSGGSHASAEDLAILRKALNDPKLTPEQASTIRKAIQSAGDVVALDGNMMDTLIDSYGIGTLLESGILGKTAGKIGMNQEGISKMINEGVSSSSMYGEVAARNFAETGGGAIGMNGGVMSLTSAANESADTLLVIKDILMAVFDDQLSSIDVAMLGNRGKFGNLTARAMKVGGMKTPQEMLNAKLARDAGAGTPSDPNDRVEIVNSTIIDKKAGIEHVRNIIRSPKGAMEKIQGMTDGLIDGAEGFLDNNNLPTGYNTVFKLGLKGFRGVLKKSRDYDAKLRNIFMVGVGNPVLTVLGFRKRNYFDETGTPVLNQKTVNKILKKGGSIFNQRGEVILTPEDLKVGLLDDTGKILSKGKGMMDDADTAMRDKSLKMWRSMTGKRDPSQPPPLPRRSDQPPPLPNQMKRDINNLLSRSKGVMGDAERGALEAIRDGQDVAGGMFGNARSWASGIGKRDPSQPPPLPRRSDQPPPLPRSSLEKMASGAMRNIKSYRRVQMLARKGMRLNTAETPHEAVVERRQSEQLAYAAMTYDLMDKRMEKPDGFIMKALKMIGAGVLAMASGIGGVITSIAGIAAGLSIWSGVKRGFGALNPFGDKEKDGKDKKRKNVKGKKGKGGKLFDYGKRATKWISSRLGGKAGIAAAARGAATGAAKLGGRAIPGVGWAYGVGEASVALSNNRGAIYDGASTGVNAVTGSNVDIRKSMSDVEDIVSGYAQPTFEWFLGDPGSMNEDGDIVTTKNVFSRAYDAVTSTVKAARGDVYLITDNSGFEYTKLHKTSARAVMGMKTPMRSAFFGMCKEYFEKTGKKVQINSAYRSVAEQWKLYRCWVAKKCKNRAAKGGSSMHNFGLAVDINSADADALDKLGLMRKYGFWRPVSTEPHHLEPICVNPYAGDIRAGRTDPSDIARLIPSFFGRGGGGPGSMGKGNNATSRDPKMYNQIIKGTAIKVSKKAPSVPVPSASLAAAPVSDTAGPGGGIGEARSMSGDISGGYNMGEVDGLGGNAPMATTLDSAPVMDTLQRSLSVQKDILTTLQSIDKKIVDNGRLNEIFDAEPVQKQKPALPDPTQMDVIGTTL